MHIDFFYSSSRGDLRPELEKALKHCRKLKIITGFVTEAGLRDLGKIDILVEKLELFVFGHCNRKALEAMETLNRELNKNGKSGVIKLHFGYGHQEAEKNKIQQIYRPMMHSKVFLFDYDNGQFTAFIGSQNITGYSLNGLNSEAIVKIEGQITDEIYSKILQEMSSIQKESEPFRNEFLDIYEDWHINIVKGLIPDEMRQKWRYLSVLYALIDKDEMNKPKIGDQLYFEIPNEYIGGFNKIDSPADVWIIPIDLTNTTWRPLQEDIMFFRAMQRGAHDPVNHPMSYPAVEWHIADYNNPIIERLDKDTVYHGGEIQVYMEFQDTFSTTYPQISYDDVTYVPPTRNSSFLTPVFDDFDSEGLRPYTRRTEKPMKDQEELSQDNWRLIRRFRQMEDVNQIDIVSQAKLPKPSDLIKRLDVFRKGVYYKPKVRLLEKPE